MTDQPMLTYNKLACLWQVAPLEAEMVNLEPHERFLGFHEGLIWSQHPEKCGLGMYASTIGAPKVAPGLPTPGKSAENGTQNPGFLNAILYMFELWLARNKSAIMESNALLIFGFGKAKDVVVQRAFKKRPKKQSKGMQT